MIVIIMITVAILWMLLSRRIRALSRIKDNEVIKTFVLVGLFLIALITGVIGMNEPPFNKSSMADKSYWLLAMFVLNYTEELGLNVFLHISRYSAALFTTTAILNLTEKAVDYVYACAVAMDKKSVVLYGKNEYTRRIREELWTNSVEAGDKYIPTRGKIILLGSEEENLRFYSENRQRLSKLDVFIKTENLPGVSLVSEPENGKSGSVKYFSMEELAALRYWKKYPVVTMDSFHEVESALESESIHRIAVIGSGPLVEELLLYGTQFNVYNEKAYCEYHIYLGNEKFVALHDALSSLHIVYHSKNWYEITQDEMSGFERVIIAGGENAMKAASEARLKYGAAAVHLILNIDKGQEEIIDSALTDDRGGKPEIKDPVVVFPVLTEACTAENILYEKYQKMAVDFNEFYGSKNPGSYNPWEKLSSYHKYSNIFSVYLTERYYCSDEPEEVLDKILKSPKLTDLCKRAEHVRWNNYNYFFNWKFESVEVINRDTKAGEKTSTKNWNLRLHYDLQPYDMLSSDTQESDNSLEWLCGYAKSYPARNKKPKRSETMYKPEPLDTGDIELSGELTVLQEKLAKNVHEIWARGRLNDGWTLGDKVDSKAKKTPWLIPYEELPESEKEYDRNTAMETLKMILKLGYKIEK